MRKNYKLKTRIALAACLVLFGYRGMAQVSVTATAGTTTGTYTTVNAAFAAINAGTHQGVISIGITANTTEPATPTPLLASGTGSSVFTAISIMPVGGDFIINSAAAPVANRGIIELAGADNVTIDGDDAATAGTRNLSIVSAAVATAGVACVRLSSNSTTGTDGANNVTVKNCIIRGSRSSATSNVVNYGIQFSNGVTTSSSTTGAYSSLNTIIQNNIITRCWYGINTIGNSATYLNTGLQIIGNTIGSATNTEYVAGRGIVVSYTAVTPGAGSALIKGNDIRTGHTNGTATLFSVDVAAANAGLTITSNNIHDCINPTSSVWGLHAIDVNSSTSNTGIRIENNFIRDITGYTTVSSLGNQYAGIGIFISADVTGLLINNNSIVQSTASRGTCVLIATGGTTIAQFQNNLLMENENSAYSSCFYTVATGNISGGVVNNNNYYMAASAILGYYNGASQATLAAWRTATGKDALSLNELPVFTSATDLHVPAGTITLLESGGASTASTGVTTDIDAQTRPGVSSYGYGTAPDIGADEFDGKAIYSCVTPTPGNTIASSNPICIGSIVNFSLQNATAGTGVSYQWQTSPDNVTYTNIAGANLPTYSTTPTTDSYYRAVVTCAQGPVTGTSIPVHITYNYAITGTTPGSRCGAGTVSLAATGSGTNINWYAAATGGSSLGAGSPFTTPVISSTTTYYAEPSSISPASITIGTGANLTGPTTQPTAFCNRWKQYWCQMVYTAAELNAAGLVAGNITSISFRITTLGDAANVTNFSVSLGPVATTTLTGFTTTGLTTVYGPATYTHAVGVNTITFATPYAWDGVSNILVDLKQNGADLTNNAVTYFTPTAGNTCASATTSSVTPVLWTSAPTATLNTQRLDATFAGVAACAGARTAVVATIGASPVLTLSANQTVCNDGVAALSVTSTLSNYDSYVWSPTAGLFTDAAGTVAYTGTSASTVYARTTTAGATVYTATANNTATSCSAIATSTVTVLPSSVTISSSVPSVCGSGSATLSASPSTGYGAGSLQWQTSPDGITFTDIASATGTTYTTPSISSTTYYRITVKNGAGTACFNSAPFTLNVVNPAVTGTTPATRCGAGPLTLGATANAGSTLSWYATASGGAVLATGTSFTTPSLSATTTYYVAAGNPPTVSATLGAGATTSASYDGVFYHLFGGAQTQFLVRASELTAMGLTPGSINSVGINMSTVTAQAYTGFAVSIGTTPSADLSAGLYAGALSTVYTAATYTPVTGINTFTFGTPFTWDGVSNIIIKFCWSNNNSGGTSNFAKVDAPGFVSCAWYRGDNLSVATVCSGTTATGTNSNRPQFIFSETGCSSALVPVIATITTPPAITAASTPGTVCSGTAATLTASSSNSGYTFTWNPGTLTGATQSVTPAASTTYTLSAVDVSGGANNGCIATTTTTAVTVVPSVVNPTATSTPAAICAGSSTTLAGGADPVASTLLTENFNGAATGWTTTNTTTGGTPALAAWTLRANGYAPGGYWATVAPTVTALNSNDASQFYLTNADAPGTGSATNTTLQSPSMSTVGYSTLNLSFYNFFRFNASPDSANVEVSTNGTTWTRVNTTTATLGTATAFAQTTVNLNAYVGNPTFFVRFHCRSNWGYGWAIDNVTIAGTSAAFTYNWASTPSGFTSTAQNPSATPAASTTYTVTVTNAFGCSATAATSVTVNTLPTVAAVPTASTVCSGSPVTFNGSGATTYTWTGGVTNGTPFTPAATNTYTVTGTDGNGCMNTATTTVTVNALPVVTASVTANTVCAGDNVTFTGGGAATYTWTGGVTDATPFTPAATGTYTVTGTDGNGCMNTTTSTVTVNALPIVTATATASAVCDGSDVTFTGGGAATYTWSGGVTDATPFTPSLTDTYTVTGTDGNGCMNTATTTVTVNANPTVTASATATAVCDGSDVTFTGGGAATYTWSSGVTDGTPFTPSLTDTYTVTGTDGSGCVNTATTTVTVNALPTVMGMSTAAAVCDGNTVILTGSGATTYTWTSGVTDGTAFTPIATDTYTVTGTDGNGCMNTATTTVTVNALPTVTATASTSAVCDGSDVTFTGGGATTYTWTGGVTDGTPFTPSATDTYTVTGTDGNTCMNTATVTVTVNAAPVVDFTAFTSTLCDNGSPVVLSGGSPAGGVYSGTSVTGGMFDPSAAGAGMYVITYDVTDGNGCTGSDTATVTVDLCSGIASNNASTIQDITVYPNPANDVVNITITNANFTQLQISIVDVQGKLIYNELDKNVSAGYSKSINVEAFAKGVYYIKLVTGTDSKVQKLVIN